MKGWKDCLSFSLALVMGIIGSQAVATYIITQQLKSTLSDLPSQTKSVNTGASKVVTPKPVVTTPTKVVSAVNFGLCSELDNAYKANGVKAVANLLDSVDDSKFLAYKQAVNESCGWHNVQINASYNRYIQSLQAVQNAPLEERGSGRVKPQTGSAVLAQNGVDPYEWQKAQIEKRNQEQAAINWGNGSQNFLEAERLEKEVIEKDRQDCPSCRQGAGYREDGTFQDTSGIFTGKQ